MKFSWKCEDQRTLELDTNMIQEDVIKYKCGLKYENEEQEGNKK